MDFFQIKTKFIKSSMTTEVYPSFEVGRTKDIMVRGKSFYAIWDEKNHIWSTDEYDVAQFVDAELKEYVDNMVTPGDISVRWMHDYSSNSWRNFKQYLKDMGDNSKQLDNKLAFADTDIKRTDYIS